jgi:hypothetical protein
MTSASITELALRAAVSQFTAGATTGEADAANTADTIAGLAKDKAKGLVLAGSDCDSQTQQLNLQGAAIDLAVKGLIIAAIAVNRQVETMKEQRLSFDKERLAGISTFTIPTNVEYTKLSKEEKIISSYIEKVNKYNFAKYLGINTQLLSEDVHLEYHSLLPFYKMSEGIRQPVASTKKIDQQKVLINLFFKSALPENISDLDSDFTNDWRIEAFFESAWEKENYLNNLRAPRFVMMSLANLLWHLQDPVDEDGSRLSISKRIKLCKEIKLFLMDLLNEHAEPFIHEISDSKIKLTSYVRRIELHVKGLMDAFIDEKLNSVNLDDITDNTHHSLQTMDKSVFQMIYQKKIPGKKGMFPDPHAAQNLATTIGYMDQLFDLYPDLINCFSGVMSSQPGSFLNTPPITIIDALIIFLHSTRSEKDDILERLAKLDNESGLLLIEAFNELDDKFIRPIKDICKAELKTGMRDPDRKKVAKITAQRLLPLFTLVLEDYPIDVTTELSRESAHEEDLYRAKILGGEEQVQLINRAAESGDGYYQWDIASLLKYRGHFATHLNDVPRKQFKLTKVSELLDTVKSITTHYKSFLAYPSFQTFLLKCIEDVRGVYKELEDFVTELDDHINKDQNLSRELKSILIPMTEKLDDCIKEFYESSKLLSEHVISPNFPREQKKILQEKIRHLCKQYEELFQKEAGLDDIVEAQDRIPDEAAPIGNGARMAPPDAVSSQTIACLTRLINDCQKNMSPYMKLGHKGMMLNSLLNALEHKPNCRVKDVEKITQEIMQIAMAYRPSFMFQAAYGETRSAKLLCAEIYKYKNSPEFPLAKFIFGQDHHVDLNSEENILIAMKTHGQMHSWQKEADKLKLSDSILTIF